MEFEDGLDLIIKAREKEEEAKVWSMWLTLYPSMMKRVDEEGNTELRFIQFSEFLKMQTARYEKPVVEPKKSSEELLKELNELNKQFD